MVGRACSREGEPYTRGCENGLAGERYARIVHGFLLKREGSVQSSQAVGDRFGIRRIVHVPGAVKTLPLARAIRVFHVLLCGRLRIVER